MTGLVGVVGIFSKEFQKTLKTIVDAQDDRVLDFSNPDGEEELSIIVKAYSSKTSRIIEKQGCLQVLQASLYDPHVHNLSAAIFGSILLTADKSGVIIQRSIDGSRPLYYVLYEQKVYFATEKKAIWKLGYKLAESLQPGQQLNISWNGIIKVSEWKRREKPDIQRTISKEIFLQRLEPALHESFEKLAGINSCAVIFSGGVDSSLAALLTSRICDETYVITSSVPSSHDSVFAQKAAKILGLKHINVTLESKTLWKNLAQIMYSIETTNRMDVEIAIPFFFAAKAAKQLHVDLVISGQGPDELFAGYSRYVRLFEEKGENALEDTLWQDFQATHEANIERDVKAIGAHGLECYFPYLDPSFVEIALSIPSEMKIRLGEYLERKVIFRELAQSMGIPEELALVPKKATQYSSGSTKLLMNSISISMCQYRGLSKKSLDLIMQKILNDIGSKVRIPFEPR